MPNKLFVGIYGKKEIPLQQQQQTNYMNIFMKTNSRVIFVTMNVVIQFLWWVILPIWISNKSET